MFSDFAQKEEQFRPKILEFIAKMKSENKTVVCVTSGGTSVPLEQKTVRSIENFSTGLRGSLLAQKFLESGSAVIFYHRSNSILPFTHGINVNTVLLSPSPDHEFEILKNVFQQHKKFSSYILYLQFKTVFEYLDGALLLKQLLPAQSIFVLCAAVSDFVPKEVPHDKIHTEENLSIQLTNSPKILGKLVKQGVLTVSFKLQTDESKLQERMDKALERYKVDCVIGNILNNKQYVRIKTQKGEVNQYHSHIQHNIVQFLLSQLSVVA